MEFVEILLFVKTQPSSRCCCFSRNIEIISTPHYSKVSKELAIRSAKRKGVRMPRWTRNHFAQVSNRIIKERTSKNYAGTISKRYRDKACSDFTDALRAHSFSVPRARRSWHYASTVRVHSFPLSRKHYI